MSSKIRTKLTATSAIALVAAVLTIVLRRSSHDVVVSAGPLTVRRAAAFDVSPPLASLRDLGTALAAPDCDDPDEACGTAPDAEQQRPPQPPPPPYVAPPVPPAGAAVEQTSQGNRPAAAMVASFDGLGVGFEGPQGPSTTRNPSDNSLAAGPDRIVQIVNSRLAVFNKTGKVLYGAVVTNTIFKGFGGPCENTVSGDAVVRYDQLAQRWLFVLPIFRRIADRPDEPYSMCYAVSSGADPLGPYYRYEFRRKLFPDYPRPAVWPDGYYVPSSTGDDVIQKHACVADRARMLKGEPATEQCVVIDGVNFLNNADIDGQALPPAGAPNIIMAAGGTQLKKVMEDDGIYVFKMHVDWQTPANTKVSAPVKIPVAPYHYLCDGQLTNCVPQPGTERRLDAQGDKLMQRMVYRNIDGRESIAVLHSINTAAGGGGVRWYEFHLDKNRDPQLYQQGAYAPDGFYRWMGSIGMDRRGDIGIGYSFGGGPNFAGQRFAARLADDPPGKLTFHETVLVKGEAAQTTTLRWEDYATTAMDPDDCTFWYVGDYIKTAANGFSSRIGAFRLPGCMRTTVSGSVFFDRNHNGKREPDEPGLAGRTITYSGGESGEVRADASGVFSASLAADPAYGNMDYTLSQTIPANSVWAPTGQPVTLHLGDLMDAPELNLGSVCTAKNSGGADVAYWTSNKGRAALSAHDTEWRTLINSTLYLANAAGSRLAVSGDAKQAYGQLKKWLGDKSNSQTGPVQLAAAALNVAFGSQDGKTTVHDPVVGDWISVDALITRVSGLMAAHSDSSATAYKSLLEQLNRKSAIVTPSDPAKCGKW
jgi:hypothetical protein